MLTKADAIYFVDPIQDDTAAPGKVLVTEEYYGRDEYKGQVRTVKRVRNLTMAKLWYTDEESGNYLYGIPISTASSEYRDVISFDGDVVLLGTAPYINPSHEEIVITNTLRSDQRTVPGLGSDFRGERVVVTEWMTAAPWARDLFPAVDDDAELIHMKLEVAKERHRQRKAHGVILQQSVARNWSDELRQLRDKNGQLPSPVYGGFVTADILLEAPNDTVDTSDTVLSARLNVLRENALGSVGNARPSISISASFTVPTSHDDPEKVRGLQSNYVNSYARDFFNEHSLRVGSYSITPVLRSASAL